MNQPLGVQRGYFGSTATHGLAAQVRGDELRGNRGDDGIVSFRHQVVAFTGARQFANRAGTLYATRKGKTLGFRQTWLLSMDHGKDGSTERRSA